MAIAPIILSGVRGAGTITFGPVTLAVNLSTVTLRFDVTEARAGDNVSYTTEYSFDGGSSWSQGPSGLFAGGTPKTLPVVGSLLSTDTVMLPRPDLVRQVRGVVTITGATRQMAADIEAT